MEKNPELQKQAKPTETAIKGAITQPDMTAPVKLRLHHDYDVPEPIYEITDMEEDDKGGLTVHVRKVGG